VKKQSKAKKLPLNEILLIEFVDFVSISNSNGELVSQVIIVNSEKIYL
jgi:hypothetical protein